jgi:hypothetical protein
VDDPDGYFGERVAANYDDPSDRMNQLAAIGPAVSLLAELAGSGQALELAIGTGRIGLPLSQRGVPVHGIELSRAMAARLRRNPGGEVIDVTIGDMATTRVDGTFTVAYLAYNTINNLTLQEAQLAGLGFRDRWAGWNRAPFTTDSRSHVSVWEKASVLAPRASPMVEPRQAPIQEAGS